MGHSQRSNIATLSARQAAYRLVGLQALVVVSVAIVWGMLKGWKPLYSVLLGGVAAVFPSYLYAIRLFATTSARQVRRIITIFFVGEFIKLLLSGVILVLFALYLPIALLPLVIGFVGAQFGFWLAPMFVNLKLSSC